LPAGTPFRDQIHQSAKDANLHPWLLAALVQAESGFNPRAVSRAGARGLTQLMPVAIQEHGVMDPWDPGENLRAGAIHLRRLLDRFGDLRLALAAYNAGAATVERANGVPPYRETQRFIHRIMTVFCPAH
jgi:soluble lytic murein transglycosylase-like protein